MKNSEISCYICNKHHLTYNEIGLNKKLLGRNIDRFLCIDCLAEHLEVTTEELLDRIEIYKEQGCTLFS